MRRKIDEKLVPQMVSMYLNSFLGSKIIAQKLGVSKTTVLKYLKKANVPMRGSGGRIFYSTLNIPDEPTTLAYFAGIIDGEGNFGIYKHPRSLCSPLLQVTNTSKDLMEWIQKNFGGRICRFNPSKYKSSVGKQDCFQWKVGGQLDVYRLLKAILPYLIIKHKKAEEVLAQIENNVKRYYGNLDIIKELFRKNNNVNRTWGRNE